MKTKPKRSEYFFTPLNREDLHVDPVEQLDAWWHEAVLAGIDPVDAVFLATVDEHGFPNGRVVLLKSFDEHGLVFFTNYQSSKGKELLHNPHAAMTLFWPKLMRQVRMRGTVEKSSRQTSADYFATRPRDAQLGSWASPQSRILRDRAELEEAFKNVEAQMSGTEVPCPEYWGGFLLKPTQFEFWQGRPSRQHDRFMYKRDHAGRWLIHRLAP